MVRLFRFVMRGQRLTRRCVYSEELYQGVAEGESEETNDRC